jgi:hypothetical protein
MQKMTEIGESLTEFGEAELRSKAELAPVRLARPLRLIPWTAEFDNRTELS